MRLQSILRLGKRKPVVGDRVGGCQASCQLAVSTRTTAWAGCNDSHSLPRKGSVDLLAFSVDVGRLARGKLLLLDVLLLARRVGRQRHCDVAARVAALWKRRG